MVSQRLSSALGLSEDDAGSEVAKVQLSVLVPEPEQREQKVRAGSAVWAERSTWPAPHPSPPRRVCGGGTDSSVALACACSNVTPVRRPKAQRVYSRARLLP